MVLIYIKFAFCLRQAENRSLKMDKIIPEFGKLCEPIKQSDWIFQLNLELIREDLIFKQIPEQQEEIFGAEGFKQREQQWWE